ncbi:hypothetical protein NMG60_11013901 [Bertholletia excelsa]
MDGRNSIDVSSFILVEATGDSEVDSEQNMAELEVEMEDAEDDAQSCSWDFSDTDKVRRGEAVEVALPTTPAQKEEEEEEEEFEDWESDGEVVMSWSNVSEVEQRKKKTRANNCVDSAMEVMNEMERSKLFWEACLAS